MKEMRYQVIRTTWSNTLGKEVRSYKDFTSEAEAVDWALHHSSRAHITCSVYAVKVEVAEDGYETWPCTATRRGVSPDCYTENVGTLIYSKNGNHIKDLRKVEEDASEPESVEKKANPLPVYPAMDVKQLGANYIRAKFIRKDKQYHACLTRKENGEAVFLLHEGDIGADTGEYRLVKRFDGGEFSKEVLTELVTDFFTELGQLSFERMDDPQRTEVELEQERILQKVQACHEAGFPTVLDNTDAEQMKLESTFARKAIWYKDSPAGRVILKYRLLLRKTGRVYYAGCKRFKTIAEESQFLNIFQAILLRFFKLEVVT